jgi:dolichol-phosphate mannosyltransferase
MSKAETLVTTVSILRNHAAVLPSFVEEVTTILADHYANYEVLLIDNGSTDATQQVVRNLLGRYPCVRYAQLTRPSDDETAIMAGLDAAIGDFVVTLNPDYDPPALIPAMVDQCRSGGDLVLGVNRDPATPGFGYLVMRRAFLVLARWLIGVDLTTDTTGFRALSRQAVNALVKVRSRRRFFPLVVADVGLSTTIYPYSQVHRSGERRRKSRLRALRAGISILVHNSLTPLRLASTFGLIGSMLSFLYSLYVILVFLFKEDVMPGWTTLSLAMSGLFAVVFLMLALMGEYLGRLLDESTDRPLYHVRNEESSAVMIADSTRRNVLDGSELPAT